MKAFTVLAWDLRRSCHGYIRCRMESWCLRKCCVPSGGSQHQQTWSCLPLNRQGEHCFALLAHMKKSLSAFPGLLAAALV